MFDLVGKVVNLLLTFVICMIFFHKQSCSYTFKKELNASTYPIYLFLFRRFECTTLIIKELLLNLLYFIFTNIAVFIKP